MAEESTLAQENERLKEELAQLKDRYGVNNDGAKTKKNRKVFDSFDADGNGTIDAVEFQQLCYECGMTLDKAQQDAALAEIDSDNNGVISFDEFNSWLLKAQEEEKEDGGAMVMLRMRLLGKSLARRASVVKESLNKEKLRREDSVVDDGQATVNWDLRVSVGKESDLKSGIFLKLHSSEEDADEAREKSGALDESPSFVYADLACQAGASDIDIGGLVALLETLIGEIPQLDPENGIYHSHSVTVKEEDGEKVIRIAFFSPINPMEIGEGAIGVNPANLINRAEISVESGVDLTEMNNEGYNVVEHLAGKFLWSIEIDPFALELAEKIGEAVGKGPKPGMSFFRKANTNIEFNSVFDFVHAWDGYEERMAARNAMEGVAVPEGGNEDADPLLAGGGGGPPPRRTGVPKIVRALRNVPPGPELIQKVQELIEFFGQGQNLPDPVKDTYDGVRKCVSGLRTIRLQTDNAGLSLRVKGLDFGQYLPVLPEPEEGDEGGPP